MIITNETLADYARGSGFSASVCAELLARRERDALQRYCGQCVNRSTSEKCMDCKMWSNWQDALLMEKGEVGK